MKHFIFVTAEGYTFRPDSDCVEPEVENCQVLGFGEGNDEEEGYKNFLIQNQSLRDLGFNEIFCYEILSSKPSAYFNLINSN